MRIFPWICFKVVSLLYCFKVLLCGFVMNPNFGVVNLELKKSNANGLNGQKANVESESDDEDESDSDEVDHFTFLPTIH